MLAGFFPVGATTVGGSAQQTDWIQYSIDQLADTLTGNKFWQDTNALYPSLIVH
jgi:hypothetical protein